MRGELIAFDLETTGLDISKSEIIEIGAARLVDGEITERYRSFVKPSSPIPSDITHLTGIYPEDVEDAPVIDALIPQLREFFGDAPVIAHNAGFDVGFMQKHDLLHGNAAYDTYEMAAILLPKAPRYNLNSLATSYGIKLEKAHRALDDAAATARLYWALWLEATRLPQNTLAEIISAAAGRTWGLLPLFQAALAECLKAGISRPSSTPFYAETLKTQPLNMTEATRDSIDEWRVERIFGAYGELGEALSGYESREPQLRMARDVAAALNRGEQRMIEAGTGTGKSLAYLIPVALWTRQNQQRVVVSTYTINLQEQLLRKDVPLAKAIAGADVNVAIMKGRDNYLCPRRLESLRRRKPADLDELRALAKILVWMANGGSGDRGELSLRANEWQTWSRISARDEDCGGFRCSGEMAGVCPYHRARQRAERAHILITNHALLIADANLDNRVLPDYLNLIVDEAHHLEDAITDGMSRRIDQNLLLGLMREIGIGPGSALGDFLNAARGNVPPDDMRRLQAFVSHIGEALKLMNAKTRLYFRAMHAFAGSNRDNRYQKRLLPSHRDSGGFLEARGAWTGLGAVILALMDALERLIEALPRYQDYQIPDLDDYRGGLRGHLSYLANLNELLQQFTEEPQSNFVYSITPGDRAENLRLHIAPLHVGPMMEEALSQQKESIILTSATLRAAGDFEHIRSRLYAEDYAASAVGSPFDYERSTLLYLPEDLAQPSQRHDYQRGVERGIIELAAALEGRVMVLFTSYAQLRETSKAITPRLKLGDIVVFDQSFGGSREALLQGFMSSDRAVLMGTRSFWEGIDIPGAALSAVVIARLPFAVPSDPIFAARAETYDNAFMQYAVPDAILRFRQGFGRLIRRRSDRGIVAVFDSRVIHKSYGASFLESLPECTVQYGKLSNLPYAAKAWLERD